jgi:GNAT superfamily N-acetyltransferase
VNAELLPADCTIREAEPGDIPAMLGLERRSMRAQVERLHPGRWDERELRETAAARLATARVAARGAALLGFCRWETEPGGDAWLLSMQVEEAERRRGLGTQLVGCFEAASRQAGARRAVLTVFRESPALAWYLRLGYREVGEDGPAAAVLAKPL